jgi:hypothetical protein
MSPSPALPPIHPQWLVPVLHVLFAACLAFHNRVLTFSFLAFELYWLIVLPGYIRSADSTWSDAYGYGSQVSAIVGRSVSLLLFMNPGTDFVKVGRSNGARQAVSEEEALVSDQLPLWKRFLRGLEINIALRGIGWRFQVKNIPPGKSPDYPRSKFVVESLANPIWYFAFADLGAAYIKSTPLGKVPLTKTLHDEPFPKGWAIGAFIFLLTRWALISLYSLFAAVTVGLHLYEPWEWPPLFGRLSDACSVRRFWAHTWHQMMRSTAEPPVNYLLHDVLKMRRGTYLSNYGKVFGAFFWAYLMHVYGSILAGGKDAGDWNFFMGQAVAIWVEETVVRVARVMGMPEGTRPGRIMGYVWTTAWMSYSLMGWTNETGAGGFWVGHPLGKLTEGLVERLVHK